MSDTSVQIQLDKILHEYAKEVDDTTDKLMNEVAKETAQDLRNTSPSRTGEYARGWRTKKNGDMSFSVYNATKPQLTHLLNNGHVVVAFGKTHGRKNGDNHITNAEDKAAEKIIQELTQKL